MIRLRDKVSKKEIELDLGAIRQEDGSFQFQNAIFGSGVKETEQLEKVDFPEIPYSCEEWNTGVLPDHPEQVFDYKNDSDFIGPIEFTAYDHDYPIRIKYRNAIGHLTYQFYKGRLVCVNIYFVNQSSKRDPKMSFGDGSYDVDEVFDELYTDLETIFGPHDTQNEEKYGVNPDQFRWESGITDAEGFTTKIHLYRQRVTDDQTVVAVIIQRVFVESGFWE